MSVQVRKLDCFSFLKLGRLVFLNPVGVQRDNVPHFKGLIEPEWNQIRPGVWQHFYSLPRPFENGYFTSKTAKCPGIKVLKCMSQFFSLIKVISNTVEDFDFRTLGCITSKIAHLKNLSVEKNATNNISFESPNTELSEFIKKLGLASSWRWPCPIY